jgi:predicted transcriptional regulator of viral defense system
MVNSEKAIQIIKENHGYISMSHAIKAGIAPKTFYAMRDQGILIPISRGHYRLQDADLSSNPDLITVSMHIQKAVFCLISALHYYNLTEQIPYFVYIALPQQAEMPRLDYPPLKIIWLSEKIYEAGIQKVTIDNTPVKIYSPEKTITDCFKFRNKYGLDVAIDALKRYMALPSNKQEFDSLMFFARLSRVEKIITPYIQALS